MKPIKTGRMDFRAKLGALMLLALLAGSCKFLADPIEPNPNPGEKKDAALSGTLADAWGGPAIGAWVRLYAVDSSATLAKGAGVTVTVLDSVQAIAGGAFAFSGLADGSYALYATLQKEGADMALFRSRVAVAGKTAFGTDTLRLVGSITLQVRSGGHAVQGARCFVEGTPWEAVTDASGNCVLQGVPPGTVHISVSHPTLGNITSGTIHALPDTPTPGGTVILGGDTNPVDTVPSDTGTPVPQAFSLVSSQDAYILGPTTGTGIANVNYNTGRLTSLLVGAYDINTVVRSLIRFEIPAGVTGAQISSAILRVYSPSWSVKNVHGNLTMGAYRVLKSWKEGTGDQVGNSATVDGVTGRERFWGSQDGSEDWSKLFMGLDGTDAAATAADTAMHMTGYVGYWDLNLTEMAKFWADHPTENFGVVLASAFPPNNPAVPDYPGLYSREAAVADSLKPRLVVNGGP